MFPDTGASANEGAGACTYACVGADVGIFGGAGKPSMSASVASSSTKSSGDSCVKPASPAAGVSRPRAAVGVAVTGVGVGALTARPSMMARVASSSTKSSSLSNPGYWAVAALPLLAARETESGSFMSLLAMSLAVGHCCCTGHCCP